MIDPNKGIDPRAWLAWGMAVSMPVLLSRNPLILAVLLTVVLAVRSAWSVTLEREGKGFGFLLKLGAIFALVSVLFNAITVNAGNQIWFTIPESVPLLGGPVTWNAVVYGVLSGLAAFVLLATWLTVSQAVDWVTFIRLAPARFANLAAAGSIAIAFVPQIATSFRELREARAIRGLETNGIRDFSGLVAPLLSDALDRAFIAAETLESRGFGATAGPTTQVARWRHLLLPIALASLLMASFAFFTDRSQVAFISGVTSVALFVIAWRSGGSEVIRRTSYYETHLRLPDQLVIAAALIALATTMFYQLTNSGALLYEPYPDLYWPSIPIGLLLGQVPLLVPALLTPSTRQQFVVKSV